MSKAEGRVSMINLDDHGKSSWDWFGKGRGKKLGWNIYQSTKKHILSAPICQILLQAHGCSGKEDKDFCSQETYIYVCGVVEDRK